MIWLAENFTKTQRGFGGANAAVGAPIVAEPELALPNSNTRVYHAHDDGVVYCLDGRSGEILWSFGEHDRFCKRTALGFQTDGAVIQTRRRRSLGTSAWTRTGG